MHITNILDMKTLLMGNVVCTFICVVVLAILWRSNHRRFPATEYWLRNMVLQFSGLLLIVLRGTIPDFLSIMLSGLMIITGVMQLCIGFESFLGRKPSLRPANYALLAAFMAVHAYFTYIEPSLKYRAINYSIVLMFFCGQCAWLLLARVGHERHPGTALVGGVMMAYVFLNLGRIVFFASVSPSDNVFTVSAYDVFMYLAYQVLVIALTFGLVLMVNRRLYRELDDDLQARKKSEAAVRLSESRLARAELAARSGNWELYLDTGEIFASSGAESVYGISGEHFGYEAIKTIPLAEYRPKLDAALANLIQNGTPYDLEFKIRTPDTGQVKDIHSFATYDPETRVVFGIIQDISDRKAVERELERLVQVDTLTGVFTRHHFMALAERELARAIRYAGKMSVMMIDIDRFKSVNDTYGHQVGDRVLKELGLVFWAVLREADIVGRMGGEEFAVILPETELTQTVEVAERLRKAVERTAVPLEHGLPLSVTVSIGIAPFAGAKTNVDTVLAHAAKAPDVAEREGSNGACIFEN